MPAPVAVSITYTLPLAACADNVVAIVAIGLAKVPTLPFIESRATAGALKLVPRLVVVILPLETIAADVVPVTTLPKLTVAVLAVLVAAKIIALAAIVDPFAPALVNDVEALVATLYVPVVVLAPLPTV